MELAQNADPGFIVVALIREVYNLSHLTMKECLSDNLFLIKFLRTSHVIQDICLKLDVARIHEMLNLRIH